MSGTNRLINSENTRKGGSQEELANMLKNANAEAIKLDRKDGKKDKPKR